MTKWEYKIDATDESERDEAYLNALGQEGWELIMVDWKRGLVVFKRPVVGPPPV